VGWGDGGGERGVGGGGGGMPSILVGKSQSGPDLFSLFKEFRRFQDRFTNLFPVRLIRLASPVRFFC